MMMTNSTASAIVADDTRSPEYRQFAVTNRKFLFQKSDIDRDPIRSYTNAIRERILHFYNTAWCFTGDKKSKAHTSVGYAYSNIHSLQYSYVPEYSYTVNLFLQVSK